MTVAGGFHASVFPISLKVRMADVKRPESTRHQVVPSLTPYSCIMDSRLSRRAYFFVKPLLHENYL